MGSPCNPHMFPIRSPYVRHMGKISKTTKSYVAHMLSNIWGNLWATQQHMGNIWGNVVIFAFKLALLNIWGTYGKHMGNIWETYGEHMGNIWETYGEHMGNIWGAHPKQHPTKPFPSPADAAPSRTVRLPQSLFWKSVYYQQRWQNEFWIDGQSWWNPDLTASFSLCLQHSPDAVTKREVAVSFFASCAMTKRRRCMKNYKVKPTASRPWGDRSPAKQTSKRD